MSADDFVRFGERQTFALEARFIRDPDPSGAVVDQWSYGEFRLFVRGRCLTRHTAPEGMRDAIRWYLAPLLRWLSAAWLPLLHEQRPPPLRSDHENLIVRFEQAERIALDDESPTGSKRRRELQAWRRRHALWTAAGGGVLPNVWLRRQSDLCEVSYDPGVTIGSPKPFEFQFPRGAVLLDLGAVAGPLLNFLRWGGEAGSRAGATIDLPASSADEARRAEAWMIGEKLGGILDGRGASEMQHGILYPSSPEVAMFGTLRPETSADDANVLLRALEAARDDEAGAPELDALVADEALPTRETAWAQGYEAALEVLDRLSARDDARGFIDIAAILRSLQVTVVGIAVGDANLRGVAIAGHGYRPTVLINESAPANQSLPGHRFTQAHEFAHILLDRGRARRVTHSSTPWAPEAVERRANAFAAMFLMPYRLVDAAVARVGAVTEASSLAEVAGTLRCGRTAVLEHLRNTDRIDPSAYLRIKADGQRPTVPPPPRRPPPDDRPLARP